MNLYRRGGKRWFDIGLGGSLLLVTLPVQAVEYLAVRVSLGRPVLFRQQRPGLAGRPFILLKFRTMTDGRDAVGRLLPDDRRRTRIGDLLRGLSLDELPELWNVLTGDMSLVGPRPLLMEYLPRYNETQSRRHDVRPGITGLAQVAGRNALTWEEKFALDVWYVENVSLLLDLVILARTLGVVFSRRGVAADGEFSSPDFMGTASSSAGQDAHRSWPAR